jgi:hypothetical protein
MARGRGGFQSPRAKALIFAERLESAFRDGRNPALGLDTGSIGGS